MSREPERLSGVRSPAGRERERARLRAATIDDLAQIMAIERASFGNPWPETAMAEELGGHSWSRVVVAEAKGAIVGFMIYWVVDLELHLLNLATWPTWRRRGVARALVQRMLRDARRGGRAEILLEVRRSNAAARRLYEELGFEDFGVRRRYYRDNNEDAIVMLKQLARADE